MIYKIQATSQGHFTRVQHYLLYSARQKPHGEFNKARWLYFGCSQLLVHTVRMPDSTAL